MAHFAPFKFIKSFAVVAPLMVVALVWWLAGLGEPQQKNNPAVSSSGAPVASSLVQGSFGLPSVMALTGDDVFAKFDVWADEYAREKQPERLAEGVQLAGQRRAALQGLIKADPKQALARALPWRLRNRMPPEVLDLLEQRVSARAEYSVKGARQAPEAGEKVAPIQRSVILDGRVYDAYVYGRREWIGTKKALPVEGIAVDDSLALLDRPIRELEPEEPLPAGGIQGAAQDEHQTALPSAAPPPLLVSGGQAYQSCCPTHASAMEKSLNEAEETLGPNMGYEVAESAWTEGVKDILVIRVDFSDVTGEPQNTNGTVITPAFATNLINGVTNTFMSEVSFRKTSVNLNSADVTAVLRMPRTAAQYAVNDDPDQLRLDCLAAAQAAGYVISNYDRQMVVFSWIGSSRIPNSRFGWAGLGQINGPFTWYNGYFDQRVVPHELGHNLSLYHANLWQVSGDDPVDVNDGYSAEYQDPFDCMGNGFYAPVNLLHFNPWFLNRIDWLPNSAVLNVAAPGTYRVYRYDDPAAPLTRPLALKITKDDTRNYWLSYRRRFAGVSGGLADISAGAYVIWGFNSNHASQLIDVNTPGGSPNDASLNVGGTLHDKEAGIVMTVTGSGGAGVDEYLDIRVEQENRIYALQQSYDVDEAAGSVTITLTRSGEPTETSIVSVSTEDGTAVAPSDYTATTTTVTWTGADTENKTVTIPINANPARESAESFLVNITLVSGTASQIVGSPVTVNIREPGMNDSGFSHDTFTEAAPVRQMVMDPDGQIAFVGSASYLGSTSIEGLGRLTGAGVLDATFNRPAGASPLPVRAIARQPDGKFVIGGEFTSLRGVARSRIGRVENDGGIDLSFDPGAGANGSVFALAIQADGRVLVGGSFTNFGGSPRLGLARLMPDGSLDTSFLATALPSITVMEVEAIVLQPDGKVLVGGLIQTAAMNDLFQGGFSSGLLRLNSDGSLDESFDIGAGAHLFNTVASVRRVTALALQIDGKILAGGAFTAFNEMAASRLVRLNSDGSVDAGFQTALGSAGANGVVRSIVVQGDRRIVLAGEFTNISGSTRNFCGRLLSSGALDSSFDPQLPIFYEGGNFAFCHQVLMQPDAKLLLALDAYGSGNSSVRRVFSGQVGRSGTIEFNSGSISVNEGGQAQIEVRRVGGTLGAVSVNYALLPGSAEASDYVEGAGTLVWAEGDASPKTITIQAVDDLEAEATEFFNILLGVPLGGVSLGDRAMATVSIVDPGANGFPRVSFATDSSTTDESATSPVIITLQLSTEADEPVTVPILLGGTATNAGVGTNGDYNLNVIALSQVFLPGETVKTISILPRQDSRSEGTEFITLRIDYPAGPALIGNPRLHTVSLVDDDQSPNINGTLAHHMVAIGQPAGPFEASVVGTQPMTVEWFLNNRRLAGVNSASYTIPSATTKHAGSYFFKAKNRLSEQSSSVGELVVVDTSVRTLVLPVGGKVSMQMVAAGNGITYSWRKLDMVHPLGSNPRAVVNFDQLSISKLETTDSGTYVCRVGSPLAARPNGDKFMDGTIHILKVVNKEPTILGLANGDSLPEAIVSGSYDYALEVSEPVNEAPMSFKAAGLPTGLKIDAKTGRITGKPVKSMSKPFDVTLTAINNFGNNSVTVKLLVSPLPDNLAGDYIALIGRDTNLNQNIGGRLELKITSTGAYTGKLIHAGSSYSLKGALDVFKEGPSPSVPLPSGALTIIRSGKPAPLPLSLFFEINPETDRIPEATISDGFDTVTFSGWRQTWDAKNNTANAYDGYHTFALEMPDSVPNVPRGYGHGSINVNLAGLATVAGKTGDGESITGSSFISPSGQVLLFQQLYKTKPVGSILGTLHLEAAALADEDSDNRISGTLDWLRPTAASAKDRVYPGGFGPVEVTVFGGRYLPPVLILGLDVPGNVKVAFTQAGLPALFNPDGYYSVAVKNKVTLLGVNQTGTTLRADAAKGAYSGKFTLQDGGIKRPVSYQGIVIPTDEGFRGYGYFLLPQLPTTDPLTTIKTSPILSGKSVFEVYD